MKERQFAALGAISLLGLSITMALPLMYISVPFSNNRMNSRVQYTLAFNGSRAFSYLEAQCDFGPRPPGSDNLTRCGDYIISILQQYDWSIETQSWSFLNTSLRNIIAGAITTPHLVLLAHYDTRPIADYESDPVNRSKPILGANDGASGVAALLELATILPPSVQNSVVLLFVDAEDSGNIDGWPWIVGSTYFVNSLTTLQKNQIRAAVLLDMMADADLQLKRETSSTPSLVNTIWQIAADLNYDHLFLDVSGYSLIDDHRPFLDAGIPALDIIDFDYPYWHTLQDTPDKCHPDSLEAVGRVAEAFILEQLEFPTDYRSPTTPWNPLSLLIPVILVLGLIIIILQVNALRKTRKEPENNL